MVEKLAHYKILDRIGSGGIGEVYRARDTRLGRTVAIKMLRPDIAADAGQRGQFLLDARAAMLLSHPNIAGLDDVGDHDGQPYLVFEYVAGESLSALMAGRPLNSRRALDYAVQIADALADIHAQGMVYADLRPANIIITAKGATKLLDVGLSRWTRGHAVREQAARAPEDLDASAVATAAYMSPEQALGGAVDHRTDLFSLGVLVFEMLTGRRPFGTRAPGAVPLEIVQAAAPEPTSLNRALPRELDAIVARMLSKSLDGRYDSAATTAAELRAVAAILDVRSEAAKVQDVAPTSSSRRGSTVAWLIAALILSGIGALVWMAMRVQ